MNELTSAKLEFNPNALKVLEKRYLKRDENGTPLENAEDMLRRVAKTIASVDLNYGKSGAEVEQLEAEFYSVMASLKFLPNSPTLMNAGRRLGQLSACFVLPVDDSMESIFEAVKNAALIHKSGGGTGFSFSKLRPTGDIVGSTKGVSSGPISFMTVFDAATEAIKQGGTRRGANMGMLRVDHPDILDFIAAKDNNGQLNNFNLSVAVTDVFMKAFEKDEEYDLMNPHTGKTVRSLKAKEVFSLIVKHAWKNGEPGIIFLDRMNQGNPTPALGKIESTNPCGEQPLLPYESCNLGSINLSRFVNGISAAGTEAHIDWESLRETVHGAVHFLDNVIDINKYPLEIIEDNTKANRKIGLGVMGWADMLISLGIPYSSEDASTLSTEVMKFIQSEGRKQSVILAGQRGVFPNFEESIYKNKMRLRNATITTIAPTGTLSILAGCSSGIEPLFAVSFVRNVLEGTKLYEVSPLFEKVARERGFWSRELIEKIAEKGSIHDFEEIPDDVKRTFITAHDISPIDHVRMQAAFQKHIDNAVSKTVNFPHDASTKEVEDVYLLAYGLGCKGVTVYRDGSREEQVLSTGQKKKVEPEQAEERRNKIVPRKRPDMIKGTTRLLTTGCGHLYVTVNEDKDGNPFELFTNMGKAGGCAASQAEAIGRLISLAFRSNIESEEIVKQLKGISCHSPSWANGGKISSCSDALSKAIERYAEIDNNISGNGNGGSEIHSKAAFVVGACPECGGAVAQEGGCAVCKDCGFTKCF
ncbi:ribonucleoside-diphosphate reductase NrdZ [bacterium BMS3Bbin08]|nr:ribonucleoside-diphosphate reductase NrdZ [bacterium BMS3Bbin08]HDH51597.1 vitamin B12-dependent ribonucleotide reductase [Nitrospirota bacterium]